MQPFYNICYAALYFNLRSIIDNKITVKFVITVDPQSTSKVYPLNSEFRRHKQFSHVTIMLLYGRSASPLQSQYGNLIFIYFNLGHLTDSNTVPTESGTRELNLTKFNNCEKIILNNYKEKAEKIVLILKTRNWKHFSACL